MRVRLDKRMALPQITDSTPEFARLFEAEMVPPGAPVQAPIPTKPVLIDVAVPRAALEAIEGVAEAHVMEREVDGKPALVAYVVTQPAVYRVTSGGTADQPVETAAFVELVAELHEYLVPTAMVTLDALPRDGAGAVVEAELPAPATEKVYVPPGTPVQTEMQQIWMEVLGLDDPTRASLKDDFFLSGGSSLLAGKISGRRSR